MQLVSFVKFGLVGCTGILIDFSVTWICKEKLRWNKYISNSAGFCFAVINNYFLNKQYTFHNNNPDVSIQFLKFLLISLIGLGVSNLLLYLLQKNGSLNFYFSKALVIALVFFWNFGANALFTFNR